MNITIYHRESGKIIQDALLQYKNNKYVLKVDGIVYRLSKDDPRKRLDGLFIDCLFSKNHAVFFNETKMSLTHYDYLRSRDSDNRFIKELKSNGEIERHDELCSEFMSDVNGWLYEVVIQKYNNRDRRNVNQTFIDLTNFIENILNIPLNEYGTKIELSLKYGEKVFLQMIEIIEDEDYRSLVRSVYSRLHGGI